MDPQRGIRKPAGFASAPSIRTVWRPSGAERPYEDAIGDDGLVRYKWRGDDPDHAENRALRAAMNAGQADLMRPSQAIAGAAGNMGAQAGNMWGQQNQAYQNAQNADAQAMGGLGQALGSAAILAF